MISIVKEAEKQRMSQGGKPSRLVVEDKLLMALEYLREYRTYFHLGQSYRLCERHDFKLFKDSNVRWVQTVQGIVDSGYTGIKNFKIRVYCPKNDQEAKLLQEMKSR